MVGTYTIQAGDSATTDLTVNSYTQTSNPVTDVYGNVMTSQRCLQEQIILVRLMVDIDI